MQTIVSDVSRVTLLRKRLGHAASAMQVIGLLSALSASLSISFVYGYGLIGLVLGILILWFAFRLSKHLRLGETSAIILISLWVVVFVAWIFVCQYKLIYSISWVFIDYIRLFFLPFIKNKPTSKQGIFDLLIIGSIMLVSSYFLIRGVLQLRAYKSDLTSNPSKFEPLTLNPWEDGRKGIRKHPMFLNKWSIGAYVFLIIAIFVWLVMISTGAKQEDVDPAADPAYAFGYYGVLMSLWLVIPKLYRRGRRHAMISGNDVQKKDNRNVVLYLRAFLDDSTIKMWARSNDGRIFLERFVRITFEELVTDHLWRYGPVVAIGDPLTKSKLVPLGASRDFEQNDTWQQKATDLMQQASIIVAVVHQTEGFLWEINKIIELKLKSKLVLLLPPIKTENLKERWNYLTDNVKGAIFPKNIDLTLARAVVFQEDQVVVITADKRNDWTYQTVLDHAAELILDRDCKSKQPEFPDGIKSAVFALGFVMAIIPLLAAAVYTNIAINDEMGALGNMGTKLSEQKNTLHWGLQVLQKSSDIERKARLNILLADTTRLNQSDERQSYDKAHDLFNEAVNGLRSAAAGDDKIISLARLSESEASLRSVIFGPKTENPSSLKIEKTREFHDASNMLSSEFESHGDRKFNELRVQSESRMHKLLNKAALLLGVSMVFIGMLLAFLWLSMRKLEIPIRRLSAGNLEDPINIAGLSDLLHLDSALELVRTRLLELETLKQPAMHDVKGKAGKPLEDSHTGQADAKPPREPDSQEAEIPLPPPLTGEA